MIFTDRTIIVQKGTSSINDTIILYRGDKGVEIRFTLNEGSPFRFGSGASPNIIEKTEAAYGQLIIKRPNDLPAVFSEIAPTNEGKIVFTITAEMIDEITEVGNYTFQIRLLDENTDSRVTLPEVVNGIEIREPIASEDVTNKVGTATVGYALTTAGTTEDAFDSEGNYNKTTWGNGDTITDAKLNKIEAGIDGVNQKVGSVNLSGYVTKETGNAAQITFSDGQTFQAKLDAGTLKGDKGDKGDVGPQGPQGIQGPAGTTTASGVSITDTANNFTATDVEGALQEVGSQIKDKADKIDLEVERKRIDSFVNLPTGSTTGDAELMDARIGADGNTYNNIGNAIRTQINNLKREIMEDKIVNKSELLSDSFISYESGKLSTLSGLFASDYIMINGFKHMVINNISTNSSKDIKGLAFYNENKVFISGVQYEANQTIFELEIPKGAYYIRFTTVKNDKDPVIRLTLGIIDNIRFAESLNNNQILQNTKVLYSSDFTEIQNKYINSNGAISSVSGYKYTNPIFFNKGEVIVMTARGYETNVAMISSSNADSSNIKSLVTSDSSELKTYYYIVEEDTYIMFSYAELQDIFILTKDNIIVKMIEDTKNTLNDNGKNFLKKEMLRVFSKTMCIGDSLTRGYISGSPDEENNRDYNYPYVLEKKYGTTFANFGISGSTPTSWYNHYKDYDFSQYQCAFICLGTNNKLESSSDMDNMTNIINKLKSDNSNIKIFILSLPPSEFDISTVTTINSKLQTIAQNNNVPYIDIYNNAYCSDRKYRSDDGVHFKTLGYMLLALTIEERVNNYMFNHLDEYMDVLHPKTLPNIIH